MEEKEPTTAKDLSHEVRPEHKILRDAMTEWYGSAPEGENRSVIVIQVTERNGELKASSHVSGNGHVLVHATAACMRHDPTTLSALSCALPQ